MNDETKTSCMELIVLLVLLPISMILSGYVISYGWNNILITIDGVPKITILQAIGIDLLMSFILSGGEKSNDYDFVRTVSKAFVTPTLVLFMFYVVSLFL